MADTLDLLSSEGLDTAQPVAGLDLLPQEPTGFSRGFGAGVSGVKSSLYGAGALASRAVGATRLEQAALAKSAEHANAAAAQSIDYKDVDFTSPRAVSNYFGYLLGSAVPSLTTMAVGGAVGRGLGAFSARGATAAAAEALKRDAMLAGAVVPDVALESGSIYPEALKTGVEDPALRSVVGGSAAAALDFVPLLAAERYLKAAGKGGFGAMAKGAAKGATVGAALEGGQETLQSVIERAAAGQSLTDADAVSDYWNSFLGGAAPGVVIGGGIGAHRASAARAQPTPAPVEEPPKPAGLLGPAQEPVKVVFPDGSVINSQQDLDAYLAKFTPEQQVAERARLMGMNQRADLSPDEQHAALTSQHEAATATLAGFMDQAAKATQQQAEAQSRLTAIKDEIAKPIGERRPKEEILAERKQVQAQLKDIGTVLSALDQQAGEARKAVDAIAPQLEAATARRAQIQALAERAAALEATPAGLNPEIKPHVEAPASDVIETKPAVGDTTAAETAVAQVKRSLGMLVSSREAKLAPVAEGQPLVVDAKNPARSTDKQPDAKTQQGAIETAAVQAAQPAIKELVAAKRLPETGAAKVTRLLTDALNTIAKEAAAKPTLQEAQQHIGTEVPKALKGRVMATDAAEVAAAMINAVGQSHTLYSKGAAKQTETPEFKRWFGDSKVVDESGKPLRVYHGTRYEVSGQFDGREITGWFAESPSTAERYVGYAEDEDQPNIMPAHLSISNPLTISVDMNEAMRARDVYKLAGLNMPPSVRDSDQLDAVYETVNTATFADAAQEAGYDGIRVREKGEWTWAAFRPEQIKSAIGNRGTFNPNDPSILRSTGGMTSEQFAALPGEAKHAAVDEHARIMAGRGEELIREIRTMVGEDPNLTVETFIARSGEPIGRYTRLGEMKSVVAMAVNAADGLSVAHHEGYHYAEDKVLDSRERAIVRSALRAGSPMFKRLVAAAQAYDRQHGTQVADEIMSSGHEARAYGFEFWRRGDLQAEGGVQRVYDKLRQFLERVANFVKGQGFQSVEDVFTALSRGEYAQRSRADGNVLHSLAAEALASNGALAKRLASQKRVEFVGMDGGSAVAERIDGQNNASLTLADGTITVHASMEAALQAAASQALIPSEFFTPSIRTQESNGAAETDNAAGQAVETALNTYMSRAAAGAVTDMNRRYQAGELEREQMSNTVASMLDRANLPPITAKQAFGAVGEQFLGGLQRWRLKHLATGNYISRFSRGYANVQKTLLAFVQRKSALIADGSMVQLSSWHDNATAQGDITAVGDVLLERTDKGLAADSPEFVAMRDRLTSHQRLMLKQATDMIAGRLQQEFAVEQETMKQLLPEEQYNEWFTNRQTQVAKLIEQGYVPERRYGDYTVHIYLDTTNRKTGSPERLTLQYEQFENQAAADVRAQQYQEILARTAPELKVEAGYRYKVERDTSISIQQFLDTARRNGVELTQNERERLARALVEADSARRNRLFKRKNIPGYSQDIMRVLHEFVVTTANKVAYAEYSGAMNDALEGKPVDARIENGTPKISVDRERSLWSEDDPQSGFYRNLADELADYVLVPDHSGAWSRKLRGAAMVYFIGGSLASGAVNTMSLPMNTVPWLSQATTYTDAVAKTLGSMKIAVANMKAIRDLPTLKNRDVKIPEIDAIPGLRDALITAAEDGRTMDTEIHQIMGMAQGASYAHSRKVQKAMDVWMAPFKLTEQANRIATFIAAYRVGVGNKLTGPALYDFAAGAVDNTQNRYDEVNRPGLARNNIGALLFMFKSFPLFMVEMIETLYRQNPKSAVYMLLGLTAMTGVQGLPFAETIEDLIDTIAQKLFNSPFNTRRAMRNLIKDASEAIVGADLSEIVLRGIINEMTGMSMASRVGLGDFVPGTRIGAADSDYGRVAEQILGAPFAMLTGAGSALGPLLKGDFLAAMRAGSPVAIRNLIKGAQQFDRGYAEDAQGRKLVDVNGWQAFWQSLGISSAALNTSYELDRIDKQSLAFYKEVRDDFTRDMVRALRDDDSAKVEELWTAMRAWTEQYPDMPLALNPVAVRRNLMLSGLPLNERTMQSLPRALRGSSIAAEGINRP